ncbi:hypothetical protein P9G84_31265 [Brevibacillus centrosporus]|uniref:hypothetical protein n=1 Tax=Brevibacillus centrosporus TaxID=54910 RepID=UPI00114157EE|nr:hypothetical protein [Brevibacillus centrosporus]MEC2133338.1 hypothetical protein [Brevibacillus centrosporus]GED33905.1 hypothetical protein BCE02nite_50460 [Brevibacillus centrosporus]
MDEKLTVPNAVTKLMDDLYTDLGEVYSYTYHKQLQNRLVDLATQFNCVGEAEYKIIGKSIDVVWKRNDKVILAIEIDRRLNENSFTKFEAIKQIGSKTLWISYSHKKPEKIEQFLKLVNPNNDTYIIHKVLKFKKTDRRYQDTK